MTSKSSTPANNDNSGMAPYQPPYFEAAATAQLGGLSGDTALLRRNEPKYCYENALTTYLAGSFGYLGGLVHKTCSKILTNSPAIVLASGIALAVQYFGQKFNPMISASSEIGMEGAVPLAKFVGLAFIFKTALEPFLKSITRKALRHADFKEKIHFQTIKHLNPMALAIIVAYAKGLPVNTVKGTLYTVGIFALIKALKYGYDSAFDWYNSTPLSSVNVYGSK